MVGRDRGCNGPAEGTDWCYPFPGTGARRNPTERTSWKGRNYGSYHNPDYDALYDRYTLTLEPSARDAVTADMMKMLASEVPLVPIYFYGTGVIARKGVTGPGIISPLQTASAYNIDSWEIH